MLLLADGRQSLSCQEGWSEYAWAVTASAQHWCLHAVWDAVSPLQCTYHTPHNGSICIRMVYGMVWYGIPPINSILLTASVPELCSRKCLQAAGPLTLYFGKPFQMFHAVGCGHRPWWSVCNWRACWVEACTLQNVQIGKDSKLK